MNVRKTASRAASLLLLPALVLCRTATAEVPDYTHELIVMAARDINDAGQITGSGPANTPAIWGGGTILEIPVPAGFSAGQGHGINNRGQIAIEMWSSALRRAAFYYPVADHGWSAGVHALGTLGGARSYAREINIHGQVVGAAETAAGAWHGFLWLPQSAYGMIAGMHDLGTLGGAESIAYGINDHGQITGTANTSAGVLQAFLWQPVAQNGLPAKTMINLGSLEPGKQSEGSAINNAGVVAGWSRITGGTRAFLWNPSSGLVDLGIVPGYVDALGMDLNELGHVVGWLLSLTVGTPDAAFIHRDGVMEILQDHIPAYPSGDELYRSWGISNRGEIAGETLNAIGQNQGTLLAPIAPGEEVLSREITVNARPDDHREALSRELTVDVAHPDLVPVASGLVTPAQGLVGEAFQLAYAVTNAGTKEASGSWFDRVYLSTDATAGGDSLQDSVQISGPVPAGGGYNTARTLTLPDLPGQYWLVLRLDDVGNAVAEGVGDQNNTLVSSQPIEVLPSPRADLSISNVVAPNGTVLSGTEAVVKYTVTNVGVATTQVPSWVDSLFLSTSGVIDPQLKNETYVGQAANPIYLPAGASYLAEATITLPHDIQGDRYVGIALDTRKPANLAQWVLGNPFDVLEEEESTNNLGVSAKFTVTLENQPDLFVTSVSTPSNASSGTLLPVQWTVWNQQPGITDPNGANGSSSWSDAVVLEDASASPTQPDIALAIIPRSGSPVGQGLAYTKNVDVFLPPEISGLWRVRVITDVYDQISEFGFEANNGDTTGPVISVIQSIAPNLVPQSVTANPVAKRGHPLAVTWQVLNTGNTTVGYSEAWSDRLYLSTDTGLDAGDISLGSAGQSASPGNWASYGGAASFTIPISTPVGDYYLIVAVDHGDSVFEDQGELDNVLASASKVSVQDAPADLGVALNYDPRHQAPASGAATQSIVVPWKVTNIAIDATATVSWQDRLYLSTTPDLSGTKWTLSTPSSSGGLGGGASYVREVTAKVPEVLPGGYFLVAQTDLTGVVYEAGATGNNLAFSPFQVTSAGADLAITAFSAPGTAKAGDPLSVTWTVKNLGTLPTPVSIWQDRVRLEGAGGPIPLGGKTHVSSLAAGAEYTVAASFVVPDSLSGVYSLRLLVDDSKQVFETNEGNNEDVIQTPLDVDGLPKPDLIVENVTGPVNVPAGQALAVTWDVRNVGPGPTHVSAWFDAVYLSKDEILEPGKDPLLGTSPHTALLPSGQSVSQGAAFAVPAGYSGSFFVIVKTDVSQLVDEAGLEANNLAHDPKLIQVEATPPADLIVTQVGVLGPAVRGEAAVFSWTLQNASLNPVVTSWSDAIYLSTDPTWDATDKLVGHRESGVAGLAPGAVLPINESFVVPPVLPGLYYVIVKSDAFNQVPEVNEKNDGASGSASSVTAVPIQIAVPLAKSLVAGEQRVYELDLSSVAVGSTVTFDLTHASTSAWTELYVRRGAVPAAGQFDFGFDGPGLSMQQVTIPASEAATYYILARNLFDPGPSGTDATILATLVPEGIAAVVPTAVGLGRVTIELHGAGMHKVTSVVLRDPVTMANYPDTDRLLLDNTRLLVQFDLASATLGGLDIIAQTGAGPFVLAGKLDAQEATAATIRATLLSDTSIRKGDSGQVLVRIENESNVNLPAALLAIGASADEEVSLSADALGDDAFLALQAGRIAMFEVLNLGPSQVAEVSVRLDVAADYGDAPPVFVYPLGLGAGAWTLNGIGGYVSGPIAQLVEDMRVRLQQHAASPPVLLQLTNDPAVFLSLFLAYEGLTGSPASSGDSLAVALTRIHAPSAVLPSAYTARRVASAIADMAALADPALALPSIQSLIVDEVGAEVLAAAPGLMLGADVPAVLISPPLGPPTSEVTGLAIAGSPTVLSPGEVATVVSDDPNGKRKPTGFGADSTVPTTKSMQYQIDFENVGTALAPASTVVVTDELSSDFDPASFRVGDMLVGGMEVVVPPGQMTWSGKLDFTETRGVLVEVFVGIDASSNTAIWAFTSLDPETGQPPSDPKSGFLPPEKGLGDGKGTVSFSVKPREVLPTGTAVTNRMKVVFDSNPPLESALTKNALDSDAPSSAMNAGAPATESMEATLSWSSSDPANGTGVGVVTVFASKDGGAWSPVFEGPGSSFLFHGKLGSTYGFYSVARDNAGNEELPPMSGSSIVPDTHVVFGADCNGNQIADQQDIANGTSGDCDKNGVPDECQPDTDGNGLPDTCAALLADVTMVSVSSGGTQQLTLQGGPNNAGRAYHLLGSFTGTSPGTMISGVLLPLNYDGYMDFTAFHPNTSPLSGSTGVLDAKGEATSQVVFPTLTSPALLGVTLHHAYVLTTPSIGFVSNPVAIGFVP